MTQYASQTDLLSFGLPAAALGGVSSTVQDAALTAASLLADSYLNARFSLPLTQWGTDLRSAVSRIAAYELLSVRGFNPESGSDMNVRKRYDDAVKWLADVSRGMATPTGISDSRPGTNDFDSGPFTVQTTYDRSSDSLVVGPAKARGW